MIPYKPSWKPHRKCPN